MFGLEFQTSSAGLLVFLIGAAFLFVPVFVPEKPAMGTPASPGSGPAIVMPAPIGGAEAEPNDHPRGANVIEVGKIYSGEVAANDVDFFEAALKKDVLKVRYIWTVLNSAGDAYIRYRCTLSIMDQFGQSMQEEHAPDPASRAPPRPRWQATP